MLWIQPLKRYFEFSGRSSRAEYWQYIGILLVAIVIAALLDTGNTSGIPTLAFIVMAGTMIPTYAVTFRRLHDRGKSGWLVGVVWALNIGAYVFRSIKDSISSKLLAAPFALVYWALILIQVGLAIYLLIEVSKPGDPGDNQFGAPPAA